MIGETENDLNTCRKVAEIIKIQEAMENFVFPDENKTKLIKM